jgi:hypothetical protein
MPTVYELAASLTPPLVVPATYLNPDAAPPAPVTGPILADGARLYADTWNTLVAVTNALAQSGGGAYAVYHGLSLTVSGLTVRVGNGQAIIAGVITIDEVAGYATAALADNAYNWIWLTQAGAISVLSGTDEEDIPAAPSAACVFLGRVEMAAGAVVTIDGSGVYRLSGGMLWRRTGDAGEPDDTPASVPNFWARTDGGIYVWDGTAYVAALDAQTVLVTDGDVASGTLEDMLEAGDAITITLTGTAGNKRLTFAVTGARGGAGGVLAGTYPNPGFAVDMAEQSELDAVETALAGDIGTVASDLADLDTRVTTAETTATGHGTRLTALETGSAGPYLVGAFHEAIPAGDEVIVRHPIAFATTFPSNLAGSLLKAGVAATGSSVYTIRKNGASVGTITVAAAGTTGTFATSGAVSFAAGDVLTITAPSTPDATLNLVGITLLGSID